MDVILIVKIKPLQKKTLPQPIISVSYEHLGRTAITGHFRLPNAATHYLTLSDVKTCEHDRIITAFLRIITAKTTKREIRSPYRAYLGGIPKTGIPSPWGSSPSVEKWMRRTAITGRLNEMVSTG